MKRPNFWVLKSKISIIIFIKLESAHSLLRENVLFLMSNSLSLLPRSSQLLMCSLKKQYFKCMNSLKDNKDKKDMNNLTKTKAIKKQLFRLNIE